MKTKITLVLWLLLTFSAYSQNWLQKGAAQFTNNASTVSSIHHPVSGDMYVAYADAADGDKLKVKTYNGTNWVDVGGTISSVSASLLSIKINPVTNEPWVAYRRASANKLNIRKFDSNTNTWLDAGTDISSYDPIQKVQLNFSPTGDAYVGYLDAQYGNTTEPITKVMTNKSGSWVISLDEAGYGRQWGFDYPSYDKAYILRASGAAGSPNSYINRKTLNTNGTWSNALVNDGKPKLAGLATNSKNNYWISKNISTGSNLVSNIPAPPASSGAHGKYLQMEYNPIDGLFYFLFVDSNQAIQIAMFDGTNWTLLNAIGATASIIPQLNINQLNGSVYVTYQDGSKISTKYFTVTPAPEQFYVNSNATGNNDGSSWANAFTSLHDGLAAVKSSLVTDDIWVAQGTYKPHASTRTTSFVIPTNANVYGGFNGTETQLNERNWRNNPTIFSGDLQSNDNNNIAYTEIMRYDNSYRVVVIEGNNTLIDGITITAGHANHASNNYYNRGSAIYKVDAANSVTLKNSTFTKNVSNREGIIKASFYGGTNSFTVENCTFSTNFSRWGTGFSVIVESGAAVEVKLSNSLFYNNIAGDIISGATGFAGSSMYIAVQNGSSNFTAINNTFANNEDLGTQTSNDKGTIALRRLNNNSTAIINAILHNNVFYENLSAAGVVNPQVIGFMNRPTNKLNALTFTHNVSNQTDFSAKHASPTVSNNINQDPLFTNAAGGDYTLTASSPAINIGNNSKVPAAITHDLKGFDRITNTTVDMGAYEYRIANTVPPIVITQDISIELDANGQASITPNQINNGSTDDDTQAADLQFSLDISDFTCADLGAKTVILSVSDRDGNVGTASATVTVEDNVSPVAVAQGTTIQLDANGNATLVATSLDNGSTDNCTDHANLIFSLDRTDFSCADLGFNTDAVTLTIEDASGNTDTKLLSILVEDNLAPTVLVNNITVQLDGNGEATITAADIDNGSTDNCTAFGNLIFTLDKTTFTCGNLGVNTVNLIVKDASTNEATASATVTVSFDGFDETVSTTGSACSDGSSTTITTGGSVAGINYYLRNSNDNSIIDGPAVGTGAGLSFNTGTISQTTTYNVFAQLPPATNKALDFDGTNDYMSANVPANLDYSAAYTMEAWVKAPLPGAAGYYPIFFIGNSSKSDIEVYVQKNSNKLNVFYNRGNTGFGGYSYAIPPANQWFHLAVTYDGTTTRVYYDGVEQTQLSDSGPGPIIKSSGAEFNVGYIKSSVFNYTKNLNGEVDEVRIWNVVKSGADILAAKDNCLSGSETGLVAYYNFNDGSGTSASDLVDGNNGVLHNMDGNTDWVDGTTITCESSCSYQMTTEITLSIDDVAPTATAQNITVQLDATGNVTVAAADINNGSSDNCSSGGSLLLSLSQSTFDCSNLGANNITFTVEDASGNQFSTGATITVEDVLAPTATTRNITVNLDVTGNATITAVQINNGSTDNCTAAGDLVLSIDVTSFTVANLGTNAVILTVADTNGNSSAATATVTVEEKTNQTITFGALADVTYGVASFPLSAAATSNLVVSYVIISGPAVISGSDVSITGAGEVVIEASQSGDATFAAAPVVQQSFTVAQVALTVTADDQSIIYGESIPTLTYSYSGFVNDENSTALTAEPTVATTAIAASDAGSYPITLAGGEANNYAITLTDGSSLTINKAEQAITLDAIADQDITQLTEVIVTSFTSSGLATTLTVTGPATISGTTITLTGAVGAITITATQAGGTNYNAATDATTSFEAFDSTDPCLGFAVTLTSTTNNTCNGAAEGALDITVTGGDGNYSYDWSNDTSSEDVSGLTAGTYTVTVTDGNNCSVTLTETISEPALIEITSTTTDVVAGNDGAADITITGGTGAYTVSWSNGDDAEDLANVAAGSYTVTVTDANGCSVTQTIEVGDIITDLEDVTTIQLSVYPNPVSDYLSLEGDFTNGKVEVQLINSLGVQVLTKQFENQSSNVELSVSDLKAGQYLVIINANNKQSVQRITIKH